MTRATSSDWTTQGSRAWPDAAALRRESGAVFDRSGRYRYLLWRRWSERRPLVGFILLNPSTADEVRDDPTIRRCIAFARRWKAGGLLAGNIFALRSTDPAALRAVRDPVGRENDEYLVQLARQVSRLIVAWGNHGALLDRGGHVLRMVSGCRLPHCFGVTREGHPRHPLYLRADSRVSRLP